MVPRRALQVTDVFSALIAVSGPFTLWAAWLTVAVSCVVWPPVRTALAGLTLTATEGSSVRVADEDAVASATLVAVTATVCAAAMLAGAVYTPDELIEPTPAGLTVHTTAWLAAWLTVAVSCVVWPPVRTALAGLTLTATEGSSVRVADEDAVASATLVAVTATVCAAAMLAGAVYTPDELIEPTPAGLTVHTTAWLAAWLTVAVSCVVWPPVRTALAGLTLTATEGSSVRVADEDAVASATLVAVTATVCAAAMLAGAVYTPDELIEPTPAGLTVHTTAWLAAWLTVAVSCVVWPPVRTALAGLTLTATEGSSVRVADEDAVASATLVAVTATVCAAAMLAGAVYTPDELIEPTPAGLTVHTTAWLAAWLTVAVSCVVWPPVRTALAGLTLTEAGAAIPLSTIVWAVGD